VLDNMRQAERTPARTPTSERTPAAHGIWRRALLDWLFPPRCVACGVRGCWLCAACVSSIPPARSNRCLGCGGIVATRLDHSPYCHTCRGGFPPLDGLFAGYSFEAGIRPAIHQLKYRGGRHLGEPLGLLLAAAYRESGFTGDLIVPVPLHANRQRERGYNQSTLLAEVLGRLIDRPLRSDVLRRTRETLPQVSLPARLRRENVHGAFAVVGVQPGGERRSDLLGRSVVVVDDVCTTGATLEACATSLRAAGCARVFGLTLARAK